MVAVKTSQLSTGFPDTKVYQNLSRVVMLLIEKTLANSQYSNAKFTRFFVTIHKRRNCNNHVDLI